MIKVTFWDQEGIYWAVCKSVSRIQEGGFLLDSVREDCCGKGPHRWIKVPKDWKIIFAEEA